MGENLKSVSCVFGGQFELKNKSVHAEFRAWQVLWFRKSYENSKCSQKTKRGSFNFCSNKSVSKTTLANSTSLKLNSTGSQVYLEEKLLSLNFLTFWFYWTKCKNFLAGTWWKHLIQPTLFTQYRYRLFFNWNCSHFIVTNTIWNNGKMTNISRSK